MNGKLKFFDGVKGYGFITADDGRDIFVHHSKLSMSIREQRALRHMDGNEFVFDVEESPRGPFAVHVSYKKPETAPS